MNRLLHWLSPARRTHWGTFWRVILFWNPVVATVITVIFDPDRLLEGLGRSLVIGTVTASVCFGASVVVAHIDAWVRHVWGGSPAEHGLGWHLAASVLGLPFGLFLGFQAVALPFGAFAPALDDYGVGILIGGVVLLVFFAHETRHDLAEARHQAALRAKEIENERLRGQLAALTAQMNPHLLFNALNTIASLTHEQPEAAEETTVELAGLYRGVLEASRRELHPLTDELELCRSYLAIEHARFGPRLRYSIEAENDLDVSRFLVPPLLVQPLVENAVKHGIGPRAEGGRVEVRVTERDGKLHIHVEDDGVGYGATPTRRTGTGLGNCRARLSLLYAEQARFEVAPQASGGTLAHLTLPPGPAAAVGQEAT